jgi:anti-anti-sigma factor
VELATDREDRVLFLRVSGRVGGAQAARLEEAILGAVEGADGALILDCSELIYMSSAGLRCILQGARAASSRKVGFALCSLTRMVREVFRVSGFDRIVNIHASRRDALSAFDI